jgi:AcrR family transcriptional regulator
VVYPTRSERQSEEKREAILEAALELFAERGFYGSAVPLVAERAGVGTGTVYRYFESKEALVNALYQKWKMAIAGFVLAPFPADASIREQLHVCWTKMAEFVRKHPRAYAFLELHHHGPYLDETSRGLEARMRTIAVEAIERAQKERLVKPLPSPLLVALMLGAFCGMVKGSREGLYQLTDDVVAGAERCLWEALRL